VATFRGGREAFGKPGIEPRWTHGDKEGVGTAYSGSTRLWFTLWNGIVTEVYYPTVDRPQIRDLQFLVTDGETFFHDEIRSLRSQTRRLDHTLGYMIRSEDPQGRYVLEKEVIADPHLPCLLLHVYVSPGPGWDGQRLSRLKLYVLCAPHLEVGGAGNNAYVVESAGREVLVANKADTWLALGASQPFSRLSVGYVGASDGWTDLARGYHMDWVFDRATDGNVALTGEIDLSARTDFTVGLALGNRLSRALTTLFQSLASPFEEQRDRYNEQWQRTERRLLPLSEQSFDGGALCRASQKVLLAHEDKTYPGALIASLSIPWGETKRDEDDRGGYHLVWVRDLVQCALGLLAAGSRLTPLRSLIYLAVNQLPDGSFPQNFWIDGRPYWCGIQLDEVAFPILLAHRLWKEDALEGFDPYPMVLAAAGFLLRRGPVTQQERWEEAGGFSPSTLASNIAALSCAAGFARDRGDDETAVLLEEHADFLEANLEKWTVTGDGTLVPGIRRHFVRVNPVPPGASLRDKPVGEDVLILANRAPGERAEYLAREIVDAGFLELVRYGVRRPDDPIIVDSLAAVDAVLKVETPYGVCWRRYNHDGYGQREDGSAYAGYGRGGGWPLLAGERGHYELAAGRDAGCHIRSLEGFATATGLLPEQVWDGEDLPSRHLMRGRPTAAAVPLLWAHSEYLRLLRSVRDGKVFDLIPEVAARYLGDRRRCRKLKVWSFLFQPAAIRAGHTLRVIVEAPFRLHWSPDAWRTARDTPSKTTRLGFHLVDVAVPPESREPLRFTFHWPDAGRWEGKDFTVELEQT
jgi:glucoamylase